jgi:acetyl esterase/lipase
MRRTLTAILFATLVCTPAFAVTAPSVKTWNGSASGLWSNASNWSPAAIPVAGEPLLFPPTGRLAMTNDLAAGFTVGMMTFENHYVLGGNLLTLAGDLQFTTAVRFRSTADLRLGASVRFHAAESSFSIYDGAIDVNGQTLTIDTVSAGYEAQYASTRVRGAINGAGTIIVTGPGMAIAGSGSFTGPINGSAEVIGSYPNANVTGTFISGSGSLGAVTAESFDIGIADLYGADTRGNVGTLQTGPVSISWRYAVDVVGGTAADRLNVAGMVSLGGELLAVTNGSTPADGQSFTIIDNDGSDPVSGTFTGLAEGAALTTGPVPSTFRISYRGGDGNDVVLTAIPPVSHHWKAGINGNWTDPKNWQPERVPTATATLAFPPWANRNVNFDLPAGTNVAVMVFDGEYTVGGNAMTLTRDIGFGGSFTDDAVVFNNSLKIANALSFVGVGRFTANGTIDINGQTLSIGTFLTTLSGITGSGTILVSATDTHGISLIGTGSFSGDVDGSAYVTGAYPNATFNSPRLTGTGTTGPASARLLSPGGWNPTLASDPHDVGTFRTGPLAITSQYSVDLVPGGSSDRVVVAGTVSVAGALAVTIPSGASPQPGSYTIIDNDGTDPVSGTFTGLPEGSTLSVGGSTFRISYRGGDGNDVVLTTGGNRPTTTTIAQNRTTTEQHQPVTFTATVTAAGSVPAGTVSFFDGSETIGTAPLVNGVAELTIKTLAIGAHDISAMYPGGDGFDASSSPVIVHNVVRGNPRVSVASSSSTIVYGDPVSFSITVAAIAPAIGTPTGTVSIDVDGAISGTTTLAADGTATISIPMITAGLHTVTASYSGDDAYNAGKAGIQQIVMKAPTAVALQSEANPSRVGVPVIVSIQVSSTDRPTMPVGGNVVVANGGKMVSEAQLIASAAAVRVGPLAGGEYEITASYAGNQNFLSATATLRQRVSEPAMVLRAPWIAEGNSAFNELVRVDLTETSAWPITVDYRTVDGTATANVDYLESYGTVVFNPGQTSATIPIRILGDAIIEPDETFTIEMTNAAGAAPADDRVTVVIANDDLPHRAPQAHTIATSEGAAVKATFYAPAASAGPWPVIVWTPGDTAYDGAGGEIAALPLTAQGYAVLSVSYRSAAKAPFPAQLLDLMAAVRWLRANAVTLGIDPARIVAWGAGAGGHLAALLGTGMGDTDPASRVHAVVAWGGISDLSSLQTDAFGCSTTNWNAANSPASQLIGCPLQQCPASADATAPARYANAGDAPMLLMHGSADCLVGPGQSQRLYDALRQAGVDVTLRIVAFVDHDDPHWTSAAAFAEVEAFLDAKLKGDSGRRRGVRH